MRFLGACLLTPLLATVLVCVAIGLTPYQLRHDIRCTRVAAAIAPLCICSSSNHSPLRCSLPPPVAELLLASLHAFERAPPFPHAVATASVYRSPPRP